MKAHPPSAATCDPTFAPIARHHRVLGALALVPWILAGSFAACAESTNLPPCCRKPLTTTACTDKSLYQLDSTWTSDVGREVKLGVFRGRAQVVGMFFTKCEYACPIIVNDMRKLQAALPEDVRGKVDFLLVSFDAKRDTPETLAAYRKKEKFPLASWTLLRGAEDRKSTRLNSSHT